MIIIKSLQMNQVSALNNLLVVDMPLNKAKETQPNQTKYTPEHTNA